MTARRPRWAVRAWVYLPAISSPIGGGLIKLGSGSTWAAVAVGAAPYALYALLFGVFVIGYLAALAGYLWAGPERQSAMERLIVVSANAVVSILTLTVATPPGQPGPPDTRD